MSAQMLAPDRMVYNIVVAGAPEDQLALSERLQKAGLRLGDVVVSEQEGISAHMLPVAGGGYVQLNAELSPGSCPFPGVFEVTPRLLAVAYSTSDLAVGLPSSGAGLLAGETELIFDDADNTDLELTAVLQVPIAAEPIPLFASGIEFVTQGETTEGR